jgi:hypothetical protein
MNRSNHASLASLLAAIAAPCALAQTITVNTVNDIVDFPAPQTFAQLPGPDGQISFREAVIAANNTPGAQTIEFAIPPSQFWLVQGVALLRVESAPGGFVVTDDDTTIDFTSQTRNVGDTNPFGNEVGIYGLMGSFTLSQGAITIAADHCAVKGLDLVYNFGYGLRIAGNYNRVTGCHIFQPLAGCTYAAISIWPISGAPAVGNIIGGTGTGEGNTLANYFGPAIDIVGPASDNVVVGNTLTRSRPYGIAVRAGASGTRIGGPTAAERNLIAGNGGVTSEGPIGAEVDLEGDLGTRIEGDYIGTTGDGLARSPFSTAPVGIRMIDSVGGAIVDNVIGGIFQTWVLDGIQRRAGAGIYITTSLTGTSSSCSVQGNRIGVGADGATPVPNFNGIVVSPFSSLPMNALLGGTAPGQGNSIANNADKAILVSYGASGVRISGNSINANGGLAIDLGTTSGYDGVTANDPGDADTGGNALQNFPTVVSATAAAGGTAVSGSFSGAALGTFDLEFFASPACDASGFGQGRVFLGTTPVATDGSGGAPFALTLPVAAPAGWVVTATATDAASGNTSEFSACVTVGTGACYANCDHSTSTPLLNVADFTCFLQKFAQGNAYANCDGSTSQPVLNVADFTCFIQKFAQGCP